MAASRKELEELHRMIAASFTQRIKQDNEDGIPTDAATLSSAVKFLKDNNVSADPAEQDDLNELQSLLAQKARERRERSGKTIELVKQDIAANG